jgi:hypothetical protein
MRVYVIYVQEQQIGSRTFIRETEKYGRRKTNRDGVATAGKKAWWQGCEIHLSGFGWGAGPSGAAAGWEMRFCRAEGSRKKAASSAGEKENTTESSGLSGLLHRQN